LTEHNTALKKIKMKKYAYALAFLAALAIHLPAFAAHGATNEVNTDGFTNTPIIPGTKWHLHDPDRPQPAVVTPGKSATLGSPPPSDAELLFDGKDLSKWQNNRGSNATWRVADGYVETAARGGGIRTRDKWADFQLHVEWAAPITHSTGQGRGNSGVLINGLYEVQVLDSYHALTYPDGQAGAIYGQMPPLVNACLPPGEWQTYDILFESPRWNEQGELVKKAVVTVIQNGVVVQDHYELTGCTDGIGGVPWKSLGNYNRKHAPEMFVELQDHNNPVRFRNIWIRSLHHGENL
jgi:Domain of Unknown Function (DUF1080)